MLQHQENLLELLNEIFGDSYNSKNGEINLKCPQDNCQSGNKKKFSVNIITIKFHCWVCGYCGRNIFFAIRKFGSDVQILKAMEILKEYGNNFSFKKTNDSLEKIQLPLEFKLLSNNNDSNPFFDKARNYLYNRGIFDYDIIKYKIGYCISGIYHDRIIVPSFGINGILNYFISRSFIDSKMKYLNPKLSKDIIFNEVYLNWSMPIYIVEGFFDALKVGDNAIPVLGSSLDDQSYLFDRIVKNNQLVYIFFDYDALNKAYKVCKLFISNNIKCVFVKPCKDYDAGEMSKQEVVDHIKNNSMFINDKLDLLNLKLAIG